MGFALFVGRILFGGFFLFSGLNHFLKLDVLAQAAAAHDVPYPRYAVALSGAMIVAGGLSLITGVLPRLGLALIALFLLPVSVTMHAFWADSDPQQRMNDVMSFMKNMAMLGGALGMMAVPVPWPFRLGSAAPNRPSPRVGRAIPHG